MAGRQIARWKKQILCIAGSLLLYGAAVWADNVDNPVSKGYLERGGYGEESKRYDLLVDGAGREPLPCTVEISPLRYGEGQALEVMEQLFLRLPQMICGENESLNRVTADLKLLNSFEGTGIRAAWQSRNPEVMDSYGQITAEKIDSQGSLAVLGVILTDGTYKKEGELEVWVYPASQSDKEREAGALQDLIQKADLEAPEQVRVTLPDTYNGGKIRYREAGASDYRLLPILGVILAALLYGQEKAQEEKEKKHRQQMLLMDYADVVYQLMVYIGAGLTVGKAWECMVQNYERKLKKCGGRIRPAYEEMALTLHQIQYGEPEGKAIEAFGRRCRLQPYMKLSTLLEQNRRTGTKNLKQLLEQEMTAAWEEQKHTARRLGEEAGTRLLAPLFLMLVVVMVIIMVPALVAVQ